MIRANYKDRKIIFNSKEMEIKRGSFITSLAGIKKDTHLSIQKIRTSLAVLTNVGFLTHESTNQFTKINVLNYDEYQSNEEKDNIQDNTQTNKRITNGQQTDNNRQEVKEVKELKEVHLISQDLPIEPKPLTSIQKVVLIYKGAKGIPEEDKAWDRVNFPRYTKSAKLLLEIFNNNIGEIIACICELGEKFDRSDLTWTLETIVKHASEFKLKQGVKDNGAVEHAFK
jgi:hypothetical protein